MAKNTFGEHLKREREMRGVSLDEISSATRIGTRFLEALENEQWDRLPGGVFNRGFVRAIARFLGLDEEDLLAEYALATSDQPDVPVWAGDPASPSTRTRRLPWLLALLALLAAAGGGYGYHHYASRRAARDVAPGGPALAQPAPSAAAPAAALPAAPASLPAPTPTSLEQPGRLPAGTPRPPAAEPDSLELTVSAGKTTVMSVLADGHNLFNGKITAGENLRFHAQERFEISAGNSSALLLELNGQTMAPMGPPGRPGKVTLTRKDLKPAPGGPD